MDLLEREVELAMLQSALDGVAVDGGRLVLVSGEAGIGKTTFVEAFTGQQRDRPILWGACDDLFTPRPLGPLHDIARQTGGDLAEQLQKSQNRSALFAACLNELQSPCIAVFEDIHWADEATIDFLKFVGRRLHRTRALLLATFRNDELGPDHPLRRLLGDLARAPHSIRLELSPLSKTAVKQLAANRAVDVEALHRQTGGNPFFVTEILAANATGIPTSIRDAVLARVTRLSLSGRAVLNAAAVIGARIEPPLLQQVAQADAPAVEESLKFGILRSQDDYYTFRHELGRQTILDAMTLHQRLFWHQAVLDGLALLPHLSADAARLAHHAVGAQNQEAIVTYARQAGAEAAALGMHRAAVTWLDLVIPFAERLPIGDQIELFVNLGLNNQAQNLQKSLAAFGRAAELADAAEMPLKKGLAWARMAVVHYRLGELDRCDALLQDALELMEPLKPNPGLIATYPLLAMRQLTQGEAQKAAVFANQGYQMALAREKVEEILQAYQVVGLCTLPLDYEHGLDHLKKCLDLALENDQYRMAGTIYANLLMHTMDSFKTERAAALVQQAKLFMIEHDLDFNLTMVEGWEAMLRLFKGDWDACQTLVDNVLNGQPAPIAAIPALVAHGRLLARRGNFAEADARLEEARKLSEKINNQQRIGIYYCAAAEAAWLSGKPEAVERLGIPFMNIAVQNRLIGFAAEMAYWLWRTGRPVELHDWMVQPFVLEIEGDWQAAADGWAALGCPYEHARALAGGDLDAQKEALILFEQLGARPMIEWVRHQLRQAGVHALPRGPRITTQQNPFGLTNRQVDVLRLLVDGLTNTEIGARLHISPKTVDHHVSAVLGKMQVASREKAAAAARMLFDN